MAIYEVMTIGLDVALAAATTAAILCGLLGLIGAFFLVRCASCGHVACSSVDQPPPSCWRCRHTTLLHPAHALHRRGHPNR
ncbi:hypothetical protein CIW49_05750 [Mycolicibacterium sp. P1-18]|uniref:hypothetical protein n=1 Tax=Mycolicibacterium sp. P1-18 TaxID=2024615 RepID=UPI0011F21B38|nr:hypothetical protein [Mycolicibacterium sp. P1-18]KAA0101019.1 hypothetical protein CIW49_05750 [Mycolicibacterium sp. P1-18]